MNWIDEKSRKENPNIKNKRNVKIKKGKIEKTQDQKLINTQCKHKNKGKRF